MSIQLAAAERLVERDPQMAKEAVSTARATAKAALDDIRSMIGVLRHGDDAAETMPAAGTNQVDELESYLRGAGLDVTLDMAAYDRARVPAHVDMALFTVCLLYTSGPDKLPAMAKTLGKAIGKFRNAQEEMNKVIKNEVYLSLIHICGDGLRLRTTILTNCKGG